MTRALLCVPAAIVAMEHEVGAERAGPGALMRLGHTGEPRWTTTLPMDVRVPRDEFEIVHSSRDTWVCSYFSAGRLTISADAVLVVFANTPRTGIGVGYVASLDRGKVRYYTRCGPIQQVAALGDGEFIVGYQGYGEFESLRYGHVGRFWTHGQAMGTTSCTMEIFA